MFNFEDLTQADFLSQSLAAKRKGYSFRDFIRSFYLDSVKVVADLKFDSTLLKQEDALSSLLSYASRRKIECHNGKNN